MFSSGMDLNDLRALSENPERTREGRRPILQCWNLLEEMPKPTICQIHGGALGGAFELALACDFRTMAEDAVAGIMEVRVGLIPDVGGCSRLPAVVGLGNAKELIMTGKVIDGNEAHRIGFANRVAPADRAGRRDRGVRERAARVRAARGRPGEACDRRGGEAGARPHARAGDRGAGDARGVGGLRGGRARLLREARSGVRGALARVKAAEAPASVGALIPRLCGPMADRPRNATGPDAVVRARIANCRGRVGGTHMYRKPAPAAELGLYPGQKGQTPNPAKSAFWRLRRPLRPRSRGLPATGRPPTGAS